MNPVGIAVDLWQFSPIPNIEESNFNKILERFYSWVYWFNKRKYSKLIGWTIIQIAINQSL